MKVLWKHRSDVKWLPFFDILENFRPNLREGIFREFFFLEQFCAGTWPGQKNTSNDETKNNDNRKATKQELVRKWLKKAPTAFS